MTPKELTQIRRLVTRQKASFSEIYGAAGKLLEYIEDLQTGKKEQEERVRRLICIQRDFYKDLDEAVRFLERHDRREALNLRVLMEIQATYFEEKDWETLGRDGFKKQEPGPVFAAYGAPFCDNASAGPAYGAPFCDDVSAVEYEPSKFQDVDIVLMKCGPNKIKVTKEVRSLTTLGLREAKAAVEGAPVLIKENIWRKDAQKIQEKFQEIGATVELHPYGTWGQ